MPGSWSTDRFPQFADAIRRLTEQHRELEDEPLRLAISYLPAGRDPQDIYLFEVVETPDASISASGDLFEVEFATSPGFRMGADEQLHLILTNPRELETALKNAWPLAVELTIAIHDGDYQVLFQDAVGQEALARLQEAANRPLAAHG
jgi:hypothetical protein